MVAHNIAQERPNKNKPCAGNYHKTRAHTYFATLLLLHLLETKLDMKPQHILPRFILFSIYVQEHIIRYAIPHGLRGMDACPFCQQRRTKNPRTFCIAQYIQNSFFPLSSTLFIPIKFTPYPLDFIINYNTSFLFHILLRRVHNDAILFLFV